MKLFNLFPLLFLFFCTTNNTSQKNIEETILKYDSKLGLLQKSYRLRNEQTTSEFESLLNINTFKSLASIENSISFSLSCQETIKSKGYEIQQMLDKYGGELKSFIPKQDDKNKFEVQWLETSEDILQTMYFDIDAVSIYLRIFLFVKKHFSDYEIDNNSILFENEDLLKEYNGIVMKIDYIPEITFKQTELRSKVIKEYTQLINSVKNNARQ